MKTWVKELRAMLHVPNLGVLSGVVVDIGPSGALLKCTKEVPPGSNGKLVLGVTPQISMPVSVFRVDKESFRPLVGLGLQYGILDAAARRFLSDLAPWSIQQTPEGAKISFRVGFTEATNFASLLGAIQEGRVTFDVEGVRQISSIGVKKWVLFLERLCDRGIEIRFERASAQFLSQSAMIRNFLGCGRIVSALVPYSCPDCGKEMEELLEIPAEGQVDISDWKDCDCGSEMELDMVRDILLMGLGVHS